MNSLIHELCTAKTKNYLTTCGKSSQRIFVSLLFSLLISLQTFAASDSNFDLNVDCTPYPATCGENNGAITTAVSGGVLPYLYMWSNGQSSTGIVNLAPGNYTVTVTDAIGNTATCSGVVIGYPGITISSVIVIEATCGNNDGLAIVNVVGDPANFNFVWSSNVPSSNGPMASGLSSGTYSVTITNPSQPGNCSLEETFTVGNVDGPETTLVTTASVCGEDNGTATFGNPNYTYTWNPSIGTDNGNIRTDLPAGTYFVTITDPLDPGCDNVTTVVIDEIPSITVDYMINSLPDCGIANGSVTINATGGSGIYSYSWGSQTVSGLASGTYEVTVTDTNTGCTGSVIFILLDGIGGATVVVDDVMIDCAGDMDGTVEYTVTYSSGFAFPADTTIQDANGNEYINGSLSPGSYCIVIKDANGCFTGGECFEIEEPTQIDGDLAIIDATCTELGSITIELTGGAGGYTYAWSPNVTSPSGPVASDLSAGTYSVTITDANGCSGVVEDLIVEDSCPPLPPCNLSITSVVVIESSCGNSEGIAIVNVAGDPDGNIYNYTWSSNVDSILNNKAFDLSAGTYSVTVENPADTCSVIETFTVGNIDGPESDYDVTPSVCGVDDGTVTFDSISYSYAWSPSLGTPNAEGNVRTNLPGGSYFITITDPANPGCEDVITVVVEEISPLTVSPFVISSPDCDSNNGSVTINALGGSGAYTFDWGPLIGIAQTISNLETGVYQVTVTDNNTGCAGVTTFSLSANNPQADIIINSIDTLLCSGDESSSVDFTVNYGAGFAFPADTLIVDGLGNTYTNDSLPAGSYCVLIIDANGCQQAGDCFEIENPDQIDVDISIYPVECDSFGFISLAITGGTPPYMAFLDGSPIPPGFTIGSLDPGTYLLTVTDANGCNIGAAALFVGDNCPPPPPPPCILSIESVVVIESSCGNSNGKATVNVAGDPGGTINNYTWSSNVSSSMNNQAFDLSAGTYSVTIEDPVDSTCILVETFTVGNIDGPEATYTTTPSDCSLNNGSVTFSNPNYQYTWLPNLGNGGSSNIRTDIPSGVYFVTIVDPAVPDCPDVVTVVVEEVGDLDVVAQINQNPDCGQNNGSVTINASGGSGFYSYSWGGQTITNLAEGTYEVTVTDDSTSCTGSVIFVLTSNDPQATITIDSEPTLNCAGDVNGFVGFTVGYLGGFAFPADTIIQDGEGNIYTNGNLPSGSYCIVITDANGCFNGEACFEIEEPAQVDVDISIYPQDCDQLGSISLAVTGGAGGYVYTWSPPQIPSDSNAENLTPGTYGLTVTDANGCSVFENNLIVGDSSLCCAPPVIDGLLIINATCDNADGWAFINIDGGPTGFTYTWSSNVTNPAGPFAFGLAAGIYSVTVADENFPDDCFVVETFAVENTPGPDPDYVVEPSTCGEDDGTITFSDPTYNYAWDPAVSSGPVATGLSAGTYFVTITDSTNCVSVKIIEVEEIPSIVVDYIINTSPDCNLANGSVSITASGGSGNYTYTWDPNIGTPNPAGDTRTDLPAGLYAVTVTDDSTGCTGSVIVPLSPVSDIDITINSVSEILCPGDESGTVTYTVNSSNPTTVEIVDLFGNVYDNGTLVPGFYCIIASDTTGCFDFECFEIEAPTQINVVVEITDEACDSLGSIALVDVNGGAGGYVYTWNPPVTTGPMAIGLEPGDYEITVTDANGCSISGVLPVEADTNKITIDLMPDTLICDTSIIIDFTITPENATVVWTDEDGNPFDPSMPVSPVDTSIYYVEVTSGDCFAMDSVMIIEGAVNIVVEYDSISCVGVGSMVSVINLDLGDSLVYSWGPDSLIVMDGNENTSSPTINTVNAGIYSIFYDITNQYGCMAMDTITVEVVDSLVVDTIISTMQCDSLTVDFSIAASPFITYVWNFGDPGNPGGAIGPNPSHEYSDSGCFIVTLILLPNSNVTCFQQDTILYEVCVVDPPIFNLGIDVSVDCNDNGAEVTLTDITTSPLGQIVDWGWTINNTPYPSNDTVVLNITESEKLEVEMIVLNEQGCTDTLTQSIPINIIDIAFPDTILACEVGDSIQLYNGSDMGLVFEWSPPDIFDDPNDPFAVAIITEDVTITVAISDTANLNSCPQADTIEVILTDPINLIIEVPQEGTTYCNEDDLPSSITANCSNCDPNLIEWSLNDPNFNNIYGTGSVLENSDNPGDPLVVGTYYVQFIDAITGCSDMDSVTLSIEPIINWPLENQQTICIGDTTELIVGPGPDEFPGINIIDWVWEGSNIIYTDIPYQIYANPTQTESYTLIVTTENGCVDSSLIEIVTVINIGDVTAAADPTEVCIYFPTQLSVNQIPGVTYIWSNEETLNDPTISNPTATPLETTTYDVLVTDEESGCEVASSVTVTVVHPACEEPFVFFPNAFTPNGDGHNDELCLRGSDVTDVYFIIYNRWGEKMFESNSQEECWDGTFNGKELGADVYGYYLKVSCGNGEEFIKKGNVTILR